MKIFSLFQLCWILSLILPMRPSGRGHCRVIFSASRIGWISVTGCGAIVWVTSSGWPLAIWWDMESTCRQTNDDIYSHHCSVTINNFIEYECFPIDKNFFEQIINKGLNNLICPSKLMMALCTKKLSRNFIQLCGLFIKDNSKKPIYT